MKNVIINFCTAVILLGGGCFTTTMYPLYTDDTIISNSALIGTWIEAESGEILKFTESEEKSYKLVYIDEDGRTGHFEAHLLKLGDNMFLDLYPAEEKINWNDAYKEHFLLLHSFIYVEEVEPILKLAMLEPEWLEKFLKENPRAVAHEKIDGSYILTAASKQLQSFIIEYARPDEAFGEVTEYVRAVK